MSTNRTRVEVKDDAAVTPLELFFDLVFVYALTQVTSLIATHLTARGLAQGTIVLALVWWCWVGFSWLGNAIRADEGVARLVFFAVMATMFVASLVIPESFVDLPGGLHGPAVFAACYAIVRYLHLALYAYSARTASDRGLSATLARFAAVASISVVLLFIGAFASVNTQLALWGAAVLVDYVGTQLIGAGGWRLSSPAHFSERHGLIVLIALGESIVAIGVGASSLPISTPLIIAAVLGIMLSVTMWWVYFDVTALAAERHLAATEGVAQTALARDSYSYLHLPMVAGVVGAALGLKKVLSYVGGADAHNWNDALHGLPLLLLYAGPALYLVSLVLFRLRNIGTVGWPRLAAAAALLACLIVATRLGALYQLGLVVLVMATYIAYEIARYNELRQGIRHANHNHD